MLVSDGASLGVVAKLVVIDRAELATSPASTGGCHRGVSVSD